MIGPRECRDLVLGRMDLPTQNSVWVTCGSCIRNNPPIFKYFNADELMEGIGLKWDRAADTESVGHLPR